MTRSPLRFARFTTTRTTSRKAPGQLPSPPSCRNGRSCATGVLRLRSPEATSIARSSPKSLRVERGGTRTRREHIFGEPGQAKACPTNRLHALSLDYDHPGFFHHHRHAVLEAQFGSVGVQSIDSHSFSRRGVRDEGQP